MPLSRETASNPSYTSMSDHEINMTRPKAPIWNQTTASRPIL